MGEGLTTDYIRTYLGLMGSGKTTQALNDVGKKARVLVYSPGTSNRLMNSYPWIFDTPNYVSHIDRYLKVYPKIRVEKRAYPSPMFRIMSRLKGYTIVLDDIAALKVDSLEKNEYLAFIRTVRFNGNRVIQTTHRAMDLPPLIRTIGTSVVYVGPGTLDKYELDILYRMTNYPIGYDEFTQQMKTNRPMDKVRGRPAGVFAIRRP